jgi:glutamate-1-semialdehyde 2,1-aminomutase
VDETVVVATPYVTTGSRPGNVAPAVDPATTTVAVEFNDLDAVARALTSGEIAAVLTEPALTNIGIVLPDDGFLDGLRAVCDETGTLLMIDETHTVSAGPGGCSAAWGLDPDIVTLGKAIAGGIPIGAYGLRADLAERMLARVADHDADIVDVGGVGGTLAGNALSMAAARATLEHVLTAEAFTRMEANCARLAGQADDSIRRYGMPWTVTRLGARSEYRFCSPAPRNGTESAGADEPDLDAYLYLAMSNRGVLITPFHNMVLMCPETTEADVDLHGEVFDEALARLAG